MPSYKAHRRRGDSWGSRGGSRGGGLSSVEPYVTDVLQQCNVPVSRRNRLGFVASPKILTFSFVGCSCTNYW